MTIFCGICNLDWTRSSCGTQQLMTTTPCPRKPRLCVWNIAPVRIFVCFIAPHSTSGTLSARARAFRKYLKLPFQLLGYLPKWAIGQLPTLQLKDVVPVGINILRGAVIMGNDSTPSIFIGNFRRASGTFGLQPVSAFRVLFAGKLTDVLDFASLGRAVIPTNRSTGSNSPT